MRICLYTSTALPKLGGQEAVVDALAREFLKAGHQPFVLAPRPRLPLRIDDARLPYPVIRHPRFYSTKFGVFLYRHWLLKAHRRHRFDVLHCHDVYPTGYLAALSRHALKIPIIITSHGGDVREGNVRLVKPGMRPRFIHAVQTADALVSIGRFTEHGFRQLGARPDQIIPIPNGVDLNPFRNRAIRPATLDPTIVEGQYILFIGRLALRKGVDTLLDAIALNPASGQVQLVIAGTGDERSTIEKMIEDLNVGPRVRLVGRADGDLKTYLLQNARCAVMPSRGWEAFPLVVLESFAAGRPVIGSAIAGLEDVIEHERTGLLVKPDSPIDLAAAIHRVFEDTTWCDAAGAAARAFANNYGWDSIARRHIDLYAQVSQMEPLINWRS